MLLCAFGALGWWRWYNFWSLLGGAQALTPTAAFYKALLREERKDLLLRCGRGTLLGLPACVGLVAMYGIGRCRTLQWALCVEDLRVPMEDYGFAKHSMTFRVMGALYFSLWNPLIEEQERKNPRIGKPRNPPKYPETLRNK
eukprot:1725166-Amphidinium_carterae.2